MADPKLVGLIGDPSIAGMDQGGGFTKQDVESEGRRQKGRLPTTLVELQQGLDNRAAQHPDDLKGMMGSYGAHVRQATRRPTDDELMAKALEMLDTQGNQHQASLRDGPTVGHGRPRGSVVEGNIQHMGRGEIDNHDGTTSTVRSMSFNDGPGREVLIPTAYDGAVHSDDDSIANYRKTGQHMGVFSTPDHADWEAEKVHEDYEQGKYKNGELPAWLSEYMGDKP